ncbi:putative periplasmic protein [Cylindrospermum stagnale PCC 7417]|uniref:Putative periplasmic protein n=1 Tax=Cylindrospermum stagnale PCC 7417 TaxID=56107 RepID=K9WQ76_9NOST|nr:periplasmic protein [Cylindrospermum stagnale]AFZ22530.1 putative periplasmic protein [Cylindrospermum stagnale PCC 7417]
MSNQVKRKFNKRQLKGRPLGLILVILAWSLAMGWLLSLATSAQGANPVSTIGTVDVVPAQYQLGQELYIENCSSCHIALPPAVFPSQTWQNLLQDSQHYGAQLKPLVDPPRLLVWRYLETFSRIQRKDEETPYRVDKSRYFQALHPGVKLTRPVQLGSCVSCHIGANDYNFRQLTPEWQ